GGRRQRGGLRVSLFGLSEAQLVDRSSNLSGRLEPVKENFRLMAPVESATRQRLIDSARYLFWERGYAGTSMADLLSHANANSGSFYHFFESKEALLREVLTGYLGALRPMVVDPAFATT